MSTEDFTTFSEVSDPDSAVAVTASKLDCDSVDRDVNTWHGDDKGVDHFGATFEHDVTLTPYADDNNAIGCCWGISNTVDDLNGWWSSSKQAVFVRYYAGDNKIDLMDAENGNTDASSFNYSNGTTYYLTIERTGETSIECRIYDDLGRTNLLDTLSIGLTNGRRYRYVWGMNCWNSADSGFRATYDVENLDLNGGGLSIPVAMRHYRNLRT